MNIKELSKQLNISIATVSRALNAQAEVSPKTRERVLQAAQKFGYTPNPAGRNLRKGQLSTVILSLPTGHLDNYYTASFFMRIATSLQSKLKKFDLDLVLHHCDHESDELPWIKNLIQQKLTDALILTDTKVQDPRIAHLLKNKFPFVSLGRSNSTLQKNNWVDFDFHTLCQTPLNSFIAKGHQRIGICTLANRGMQGEIFYETYRSLLKKHRIKFDPQLVYPAEISVRSGFQASKYFYSLSQPPTAVLFVSDLQAIGAYSYLQQKKISNRRAFEFFSGVLGSDLIRYIVPNSFGGMISLETVGYNLAVCVLNILQKTTEPCQQLIPFDFIPLRAETIQH